MLESNDRNFEKTSGYSPGFKEFFIKQLELLHARMQQFEQSIKTGWDDEWDCGFEQISRQIRALDEKMAAAIVSQRQCINELRELRGAELLKFEDLTYE